MENSNGKICCRTDCPECHKDTLKQYIDRINTPSTDTMEEAWNLVAVCVGQDGQEWVDTRTEIFNLINVALQKREEELLNEILEYAKNQELSYIKTEDNSNLASHIETMVENMRLLKQP